VRIGQRSRAWGARPSGRGGPSQVERMRRITYWVLSVGAVVAWVGPGLGLLNSAAKATPAVPYSVPYAVAVTAGLAGYTVLYVRAVRAVMAGRPAPGTVAAAAVVVVALLAVDQAETMTWSLLGASWATLAVLGVSTELAVLCCAGASVVSAVVAVRGVPDAPALLLSAFLCTVLPWSNRFQLWLWEVVRAAEEGRQAQARLAVTEERLRFARDLHDLVGHSLTAIAVKSEVAVRLADVDMSRAAAEMAEVRGLAREALHEIRAAVRGYRAVDLAAELRSVRAVLEAGGVRCALRIRSGPDETPERADQDVPELPQDVGTLLAWVIREGATNVLRHSKAKECRITLTVRDGRAVLEMLNDGAGAGSRAAGSTAPEDRAPAAATEPAGAEERGLEERGIGLAGLAERVTSAGGVLAAGPAGPGMFRLSATVPIRKGAPVEGSAPIESPAPASEAVPDAGRASTERTASAGGAVPVGDTAPVVETPSDGGRASAGDAKAAAGRALIEGTASVGDAEPVADTSSDDGGASAGDGEAAAGRASAERAVPAKETSPVRRKR
jgi:two-component system sensor histidine kinase DesK